MFLRTTYVWYVIQLRPSGCIYLLSKASEVNTSEAKFLYIFKEVMCQLRKFSFIKDTYLILYVFQIHFF